MPRLEIEEGADLPDWRLLVERRAGKVQVLESKAYSAERVTRPALHNHENELFPRPVLSFDLHRTLTPDYGFPLLPPPFEGVKAFMDRMVSRNCCIHVMSASLDRADPQVNEVRTRQVEMWASNFGLPVSYIGPNVEANVRLDDRGVPVRGKSEIDPPDWDAIGKEAEGRLKDTWNLDPDSGIYIKREDLTPVGNQIEEYPDINDVLDDAPRGWSTPMLDIDIHRTVNPGWGSTREDKPAPGAIKAIQTLYAAGFQIQMSCAGWLRSTHTLTQSNERLAGFRLYLRKWSIPYDRIVTKDDTDLWFDDKVIQYTTWKAVLPLVTDALESAKKEHPAYQTGQTLGSTYQRSESN